MNVNSLGATLSEWTIENSDNANSATFHWSPPNVVKVQKQIISCSDYLSDEQPPVLTELTCVTNGASLLFSEFATPSSEARVNQYFLADDKGSADKLYASSSHVTNVQSCCSYAEDLNEKSQLVATEQNSGESDIQPFFESGVQEVSPVEANLHQPDNADPCTSTHQNITVPEVSPDETNFHQPANIDPCTRTHQNITVPLLNDEDSSAPNLQPPNSEQHVACNLNQGRPKKGRKRKFNDQSREDRKKRCQTNQDYISQSGKNIPSKDFRDYVCRCKCSEKVPVDLREKEFQKFWSLDTYSAKCLFVAKNVSVRNIRRKRNKNSTKRNTTRHYTLAGVKVCKSLFLQTLRISSCRVDKYLKKGNRLQPIKDNRGMCGGKNKISCTREEEVVAHIMKFPKYKSHYTRAGNDTEYLSSDTTLEVMFNLYKDEVNEPVSFSFYKKVFYSKFNLRRKPLKKDTCNLCDSLCAEKVNQTGAALQVIEDRHKKHLNEANSAQKLMKEDLQRARDSETLEVLTFDMQKTLPLPKMPTNILFYKRQLWLYNCGVHSGSDGKGYFYVWLEGEAGRGSQEVGSCIKKHIECHLQNGTKELILWSDSCGGQNRNIKITLLIKSILEAHPTLEKVTMRFLISGHSYLPNDSEFGDVECALKLQQRLYTPEDYINVMKSCRRRNKMTVTRMMVKDFVGTSAIEKIIVNRKKDVEDNPVSWLKTREISLTKDKPYNLTLNRIFRGESQIVDLTKKSPGRKRKSSSFQELQPLWPNGKAISTAKLADIQSIIHLIPNDAKSFYKHYSADENVTDDLDGFGGTLDFDVEQNDV